MNFTSNNLVYVTNLRNDEMTTDKVNGTGQLTASLALSESSGRLLSSSELASSSASTLDV